MWILCTDVRDGQRIAFPEQQAAISFDPSSFQESIRSRARKSSRVQQPLIDRIRAEMQLQGLPDNDRDARDFLEQLEAHMEGISTHVQGELRELLDKAKKAETTEAIVWFGTHVFPVRGVRTTDKWEEVQDYTSYAEYVPRPSAAELGEWVRGHTEESDDDSEDKPHPDL